MAGSKMYFPIWTTRKGLDITIKLILKRLKRKTEKHVKKRENALLTAAVKTICTYNAPRHYLEKKIITPVAQ